MAGSVNDDCGAGRSSEGISSGQRCQSRDSLAEWRSSEQVENGIASTSPPYWDTDDEDDNGAKPSELYGKFTWKIENFSQISKRELRSNAFEVGGYKWYILIYPQGCDVCNHLSLFLCVANHDKLLPGWSHFAQFTIAVVNKDPKKSKYSDTLHRFWKKEHDWGWKKFMELSKIIDGFIVSDTLVIKAQVQVIREKAHRPFRCLDCQYRRELVRVYLSNVEQICRRFVEERRGKLSKLIEDKMRWSSFRAFWLGVDQNGRRCMSREKTDSILKVVVKHFFVEKEVTSTLVMDSLYSGLKALECQSKNKKERAKVVEMEEMPAPIVCVEEDTFVLADDVLVLLERAALEPLPPKDEKGPQSQNRTKKNPFQFSIIQKLIANADMSLWEHLRRCLLQWVREALEFVNALQTDGSCGEDFNKDSIERDERRLTEMGRRTVEIFVLAHIYSNRIEVAYQEAVALKRQEELIREEEAAAGQAESELKAKRGVTEKEKRTKKKQAKQKRSSRKVKDRGRDEKSELTGRENHLQESPSSKRMFDGFSVNQTRSIIEKPDMPEDVSGMSDDGEDVSETLRPDLEERDLSRVHWDTDTSDIYPSTEASSSGMSCLPIPHGGSERKNLSFMDDSSSTCSTDSVPFIVMNGPSKGNSLQNNKSQTSSPSRGKNQRSKNTRDRVSRSHDTDNQPPDSATDAGGLCDATGSGTEDGPESEAVVLSLKDRIQWLEQHLVKKEEEVVTLQKKLNVKDQDQVDVDRPAKQMTAEASCSPSSPTRNSPSASQPKQAAVNAAAAEPIPVREASSNGPSRTEKAIPLVTRLPQMSSMSKPDAQKTTAVAKAACTPTMVERPAATKQASVMSRPLSAPLVPAPRPNAPVVSSTVQTAPFLSRSVSAAGRLATDPLSASHVYVPQSYRNAITGKTVAASSTSLSPRPSLSSLSPSPAHSQPPSSSATLPMLLPQNSARNDQSSVRSGIGFGSAMSEVPHSQSQWTSRPQQETKNMTSEQYLLNNIQRLGIYGATSGRSRTYYADEVPVGGSARQSQGVSPDEFPHLDIINSLFDDEQHVVARAGKANGVCPSPHNGHHHPLRRQFTLPTDVGAVDVGPSINSSRFDRSVRYPDDDGIRRAYSSSSMHYDGLRDVVPQVGLPGFPNGQIDGMIPNQWPGNGADLSLLGMRNVEGDGFPYQLPDYSNLAGGVNGYTMFRPSNGH